MGDYTRLPALEALIDRARSSLSPDELPSLVMSDPGTGAYVSAYERVLAGGMSALFAPHEGTPLFASFDIVENLLCAHANGGRSPRHRWFSILTAGIELMGWDGDWGLRGASPALSLRRILIDSYALSDAGDAQAPLDLLPLLFHEMQGASTHRHEYAVALLCELLVAQAGVPFTKNEVEAKCRELIACHQQFQPWCNDYGEPNPWHARRPDFIWGVMVSHRAELVEWLALVSAHFPSAPALAYQTRGRLLREGAAWRRAPK